MEEKRTNPAELTVEEINVYTVDCGNTRYRCMHDCIMTMDCLLVYSNVEMLTAPSLMDGAIYFKMEKSTYIQFHILS